METKQSTYIISVPCSGIFKSNAFTAVQLHRKFIVWTGIPLKTNIH